MKTETDNDLADTIRLARAAPQLLAELKRLVAVIEEYGLKDHDCFDITDAELAPARAAIAAAEAHAPLPATPENKSVSA